MGVGAIKVCNVQGTYEKVGDCPAGTGCRVMYGVPYCMWGRVWKGDERKGRGMGKEGRGGNRHDDDDDDYLAPGLIGLWNFGVCSNRFPMLITRGR